MIVSVYVHGADDPCKCRRGLIVAAALSDRWGWERTGHHRKVVWAEVAVVGAGT